VGEEFEIVDMGTDVGAKNKKSTTLLKVSMF